MVQGVKRQRGGDAMGISSKLLLLSMAATPTAGFHLPLHHFQSTSSAGPPPP
eukprot:CAMPEP_0172461064 /NCGR_PEP_ID=MMETSP1065-20121228/39297_1 /TAXON_ID=265537 /ORGANISM="Amphiprora paludosa, Strain CCMP125" /LENGTH=51 /DNA_ID=CAMNT_0013216269 /DNA_START=110 /DNA_END=261 /DNA_ORIENTATION=+